MKNRYRTIFLKRSAQGQVFRHTQKVKNPKVGSFLRAHEDLEGLRIQKKYFFKRHK
jgi:hypothetical protein